MTSQLNLGEVCLHAAMKAAREYLRVHNLQADEHALFAACKVSCKANLQEALNDARAAFECGMTEAGNATFLASMALAGIEAAKQCGSTAEAVTV